MEFTVNGVLFKTNSFSYSHGASVYRDFTVGKNKIFGVTLYARKRLAPVV